MTFARSSSSSTRTSERSASSCSSTRREEFVFGGPPKSRRKFLRRFPAPICVLTSSGCPSSDQVQSNAQPGARGGVFRTRASPASLTHKRGSQSSILKSFILQVGLPHGMFTWCLAQRSSGGKSRRRRPTGCISSEEERPRTSASMGRDWLRSSMAFSRQRRENLLPARQLQRVPA